MAVNMPAENPFEVLISSLNNDVEAFQARYRSHRETRNAQYKAKMLSPDFQGVEIDTILLRLCEPTIEPGFVDPRHSLVFWSRPTQKVRKLATRIQKMLLEVLPSLWLMPEDGLHMTTLEVTYSRTAEEIKTFVGTMRPSISQIINYTQNHRARLIKPSLSFDTSAFALNFLPAAGECLPPGRTLADDEYTYHHLRRDLYAMAKATGVSIDCRYVVPSAHITLGRFIYAKDVVGDDGLADSAKLQKLILKCEEINAWLESEFWPRGGSGIADGGEWIVGEERGLEGRAGQVWYGEGDSLGVGSGF